MARSRLSNVDETVSPSPEPVVMNGKAIGLATDPETGRWSVVVLEFNSSSGDAKVLRTAASGSSKLEAAEKFKIAAVDEGLVL